MPPPQLLRHRELVRGIAEGEKQAHGHRLHVAKLRQRAEIERLELAVGTESSRDAVTVRELDHGVGVARARAIEVRPRLPPQMEEMLEAGVPEVRRARAAPLEQRVCRDRRPVREPLELTLARTH